MSKVIKLGMVFDAENAPDFGSIEGEGCEFTLLAEDIAKLNTVLKRSVCTALGAQWGIPSGANAVVADHISAGTGAVYRYHEGSDTWYEIIPGEASASAAASAQEEEAQAEP